MTEGRAELIAAALDALDVEALAARMYMPDEDLSDRAKRLHAWARGAEQPTADQVVDLIKAIRVRANTLEDVAGKLEEILRHHQD